MKKKRAQARKPKARKPKARQPRPKKVRRAAAAPPPADIAALPPVPPVPCDLCGDGDTLSIEAMLRAQAAATHVAAMDCLHRASAADSAELRNQALTHATRLLSLFTRQVKTLRLGWWYMPAAGRGTTPAPDPVAPDMVAAGEAAVEAEDPVADAAPQGPVEAAEQTLADDPACAASVVQTGGQIPAPQPATAGGGP